MTAPAPGSIAKAIVRVCVDLNVFVAAERSLRRRRVGGLPLRILEAIENHEIVLVLSRNMADRLAERLEDVAGLTPGEARLLVESYLVLADPPGLLTRSEPVIALGHGPHADEDARVVEAALAGRADYLVTYNVADFLRITTPYVETGQPAIFGVQVVRPADLAVVLGWPLRTPPGPPNAGPQGIRPK